MDKPRFTMDEMIMLAGSGVNKVDLLGDRGATLVTQNEIIAMAGVIAAACVLPPIPERVAPPIPSKRPKNV